MEIRGVLVRHPPDGRTPEQDGGAAGQDRPQPGPVVGANASQRMAGTTHTRWWAHEMGDTSRHVPRR